MVYFVARVEYRSLIIFCCDVLTLLLCVLSGLKGLRAVWTVPYFKINIGWAEAVGDPGSGWAGEPPAHEFVSAASESSN